MPYIPGGGAQKTSNLPAVSDVYHSGNVYVNNVPVALWLAPGISSAFGGVSLASIPTTTFDDPGYVTSADGLTSSYLANPGAYNNPAAAADGVKANFPGTVDDVRRKFLFESDSAYLRRMFDKNLKLLKMEREEEF